METDMFIPQPFTCDYWEVRGDLMARPGWTCGHRHQTLADAERCAATYCAAVHGREPGDTHGFNLVPCFD